MRTERPLGQARKVAGVMTCVVAAALTACDRPHLAPAGQHPLFKAEVTPKIAAGAKDLFEDVTARAGIDFVHQFCDTRIANIIESNGAGSTWLDYDSDGWQDLYLVNSGPLDNVTHHKPGTPREPNRLYRNLGNGTFQDVTTKAGVAGSGYGTGACAADFNNDGHPDLFVVNVGGCILYQNRGDGTFEDVTAKAGVANKGGTGIGAVFLDVDKDGWLDLFVANYLSYGPSFKSSFHPESPYPGPLAYGWQYNRLYCNRRNGTFADVSAESGVKIEGHRAMSVTTFDYNMDGAPDIYLSNDGTPNMLLVNDGRGHFKDHALEAGVAFNAMGEAAGSMAAAIGDSNGDGFQDIFVTRLGYGSLYLGQPSGHYDDGMMTSGLGALTRRFVGWGGAFLDFDNDGDSDLFVANGDALFLLGSESLLLENDGQARYSDASAKGGAAFAAKIRGRAAAVADFDNDGMVDILATAIADRPLLLKNRGAKRNWLMLDLEGTRSNRDGFGALIQARAGTKQWNTQARCAFGFLAQNDRRVHFGLGDAESIDELTIRWPSGTVQRLENVKPNQIIKVREPGERAPTSGS